MSTPKIEQGQAGEDQARRYLEQHGLVLIERNYRCRMGELDLIMRDDEQLVFVEVRSRSNNNYGNPAETVTRYKQNRLIRAAAYYLQRNHLNTPCRFDIVAISNAQNKYQLEWIKDAFQVNY
jgi:putative endonuclease